MFYPESFSIILSGMCSRLDEQEALFARVQKLTCAKVALWCLNKTNWDLGINSVIAHPNKIHNKINHAIPQIYNIKYQQTIVRACVCVCVWLCFRKKHMQCISFDTFNSFSHFNPNISHTAGITLAQVEFLHSHKQCLLFIQAWTHTPQKWYQMIWDKMLFH